MRPTGSLHLGNYHGALKNWIELQYQYDCYFFIADFHALTTGYEDTRQLESHVWQIVIDWLAAGLNPAVCDDVHPVARAGARRAAPAAVDDHAARLARARADVQGPAGAAARRRTSRPTGSSAIRCCRARTSCSIARCTCRSARTRWRTSRSRARSRAASISSTAAKPDFEAKAERAIKNLGSKNAALYRELRAGLPGTRRGRRRWSGAHAARRQFAPDAGRSRAAARVSRGHRAHRSCPSRRRCSRPRRR